MSAAATVAAMSAERLHAFAAILCTVAELGGAVPTGPMYAALLDRFTLDDFEATLSDLARLGFIERCGDFVLATPAGRTVAERFEQLARRERDRRRTPQA